MKISNLLVACGLLSCIHPLIGGEVRSTEAKVPLGISAVDQGTKASESYLGPSLQVFIGMDADTGSLDYAFNGKSGEYRISAVVSPDLRSSSFKATYREATGRSSVVSFTGNDLASPAFRGLDGLGVEYDLLEDGVKALLAFPRSSEKLNKMNMVGISLLKRSREEGQESIGGMLYACEYWGCVLAFAETIWGIINVELAGVSRRNAKGKMHAVK